MHALTAASPATVRRLAAAVLTLTLLLVGGLLTAGPPDETPGWATPLGRFPIIDLLLTLVATMLGGFVARDGFRLPAVALIAIAGIAGAGMAWAMSPPQARDAGWLLHSEAVGFVLRLAAAWAGASFGEWLARRGLRTAAG